MTSKSYLIVVVAAVLVASATSAQSMPGWIFYDPYLQPPHHAVHCITAPARTGPLASHRLWARSRTIGFTSRRVNVPSLVRRG